MTKLQKESKILDFLFNFTTNVSLLYILLIHQDTKLMFNDIDKKVSQFA